MFCSGHTFFTQRMPFKLGLQPYVLHATFQFSGTPGKRHRMREFMLWHVRSFILPPCLVLLCVCMPTRHTAQTAGCSPRSLTEINRFVNPASAPGVPQMR